MSFFWFNSWMLQKYLQAKFKKSDISVYDFGNESYKKLQQLDMCFSSSQSEFRHDITNHINHPFNIRTKRPYIYANEPRSFSDTCLAISGNIANLTDRPIAVYWSGGIDSTVALVSLMQTVDLKRLNVVCNQSSISEFPSFFHKKIKDRVRIITPMAAIENYKDFFSVSGDGGDIIWGDIVDQQCWTLYNSNLQVSWQDHMIQHDITDVEFVEEFCAWSGVKIKSWFDLRVWYSMCCKYQERVMRPYYLRRDITDQDAVSFYDVDSSLQNWTMSNLDNIVGKSWQDYKLAAKQFIYQYHNDVDYLQTKTKEPSKALLPDLMNKSNLISYRPIAVAENFSSPALPSWPFLDYAEFEDFNDQHGLIPSDLL